MARKLFLAFAVTVFYVTGCSRPYRAPAPGPESGAVEATSVLLLEQLMSESLPALASAEPWNGKYGIGLKLRTDHYDVFTTVRQPLMLRMIPGFIEAAHQGYNEQLRHPVRTASRFTIYLFADRKEWEDFTYSFAGDQAPIFCKIKTGAYYLNGVCVVYDIGPKRTLAALGHEGWHQFNNRHFTYRLPSWLDEGVAMQFEAGLYEDGLFRFNPAANAQRLGTLKQTLGKAKQIPLAELVATSPGEVLATDQAEAVMAFYSQSYALVRFLREAGYGQRFTSYQQLLWDGLSGHWPLDPSTGTTAADRNLPRTVPWNRQVGPQLFKHYIGTDLEQIEQEYLAFCRRIARNVSILPLEEADRFAADR